MQNQLVSYVFEKISNELVNYPYFEMVPMSSCESNHEPTYVISSPIVGEREINIIPPKQPSQNQRRQCHESSVKTKTRLTPAKLHCSNLSFFTFDSKNKRVDSWIKNTPFPLQYNYPQPCMN